MKYLFYLVCLICVQNIRIQVQKTESKDKNCIDDDEYDYQPIIVKKELENIKQTNSNITFSHNITEFLLLRKTVDIQPQLSEQQQQEYQDEWITWKNNIKYYSQIFSERDLLFSPEIPIYQIRLDRQIFLFETIPLFMIGFVILYCLFNYKFKQIDWLNRQDQTFNLSNIINIIGVLLLFIGSGLTIINLSSNRDITWDSNIKLRDISFKNYMTPLEIKTHLKLFRNITLYDNNQKQLNFNLSRSFDILNNYEQIHKTKINDFIYQLESQETFVFKSVYLLVAILVSLNVNLVISNQFSNHFKLYIGLLFLIISCWGFLVTGIMHKNIIQSIDICQQSQEIMNKQLPDEGSGYRYYIQCPIDDPNIQNLKQQILRLLNESLAYVKIKLMDIGYSQELSEITNINQFFKFINQPKLQTDPYILNYNVAINELNLAVQKLQVLQKCGYLIYFCKYQQRYQCYEGTEIKYNILIGLFLISISSYLSSIGCLHWHIIYIKNKHELEAQKQKIIISNLSSQQR